MKNKNLIVILGDQLSFQISSLAGFDKQNDEILMMEVMEETGYTPHHKQKLVLILSAMRHFAMELSEKGYKVNYIKLKTPVSKSHFHNTLANFIQKHSFDKIIVTAPSEYRVYHEIKALWSKLIKVVIREDERFYCSIESFKNHAKTHSPLRMEYFYREMRKQHHILMENNRPVGGRWNFDQSNRQPYDFKISIPKPNPIQIDKITREVIKLVNQYFPDNIGSTEHFHWCVNREQALEQLNVFIEHCLPYFGRFQDAMIADEHRLFHSLLSAYINIGLLLPKEVIEKVIEAFENRSEISIESTEGFIRQILGWREYVRGVYWLHMPGYSEKNLLNAINPLPSFYWSGKTEMACMREVIQQTIDFAYSHHIQRLMITGNFALLAGINIKQICEWYLAVYADAFEWVEMPNTLGMACYADNGIMASKPYAASGNYINKMSNFCSSCRYDVKKRTGKDACPFNSLYWRFLIKNQNILSSNPRLRYPYATLAKMSEDQKEAIMNHAEQFLKETVST